MEFLSTLLRWRAEFAAEHPAWYATTYAAILLSAEFVIILSLERYHRISPRRYLDRHVFHDAVYWFYVKTGLHRYLFTGAFLLWAASTWPQLNVNLIGNWPAPARWVFYFLLMEFFGYWLHRYVHYNRFLWSFHATHHSHERMTFTAQARFHVLDDFINNLVVFAPLMIIGAPPRDWTPVSLFRMLLEGLQHSNLPWRFGPFYRIFVSPRFHAFHHSKQPEQYNGNYGNFLAVWDHLFGTLIDAPEGPKEFGIEGVRMPTLASQFLVPFRMAYESIVRRKPRAPIAAPVTAALEDQPS